jgi:hypothetical protein
VNTIFTGGGQRPRYRRGAEGGDRSKTATRIIRSDLHTAARPERNLSLPGGNNNPR